MKIRLHHQGPKTFHLGEINVTKDLGEKGQTMRARVIKAYHCLDLLKITGFPPQPTDLESRPPTT